MPTSQRDVTLQFCILCVKPEVVVEMVEGHSQALIGFLHTEEIESDPERQSGLALHGRFTAW